jgi:hypothetical protein
MCHQSTTSQLEQLAHKTDSHHIQPTKCSGAAAIQQKPECGGRKPPKAAKIVTAHTNTARSTPSTVQETQCNAQKLQHPAKCQTTGAGNTQGSKTPHSKYSNSRTQLTQQINKPNRQWYAQKLQQPADSQ